MSSFLRIYRGFYFYGWQPFRNCREIKFEVDEDGFLYNPTFWCEEDPSLDDEFNLIDGRYVSVQDYDLCSKP